MEQASPRSVAKPASHRVPCMVNSSRRARLPRKRSARPSLTGPRVGANFARPRPTRSRPISTPISASPTERGCLLAACVSDVPRQDESIGAAFAEGFRDLVALIEDAFPEGTPKEVARRRALTLVSAMVGSVAMARALEKTDPKLSREIIAAAREELGHLAIGDNRRTHRRAMPRAERDQLGAVILGGSARLQRQDCSDVIASGVPLAVTEPITRIFVVGTSTA